MLALSLASVAAADIADLTKLSADERVKLVLQRLEQREKKLNNFSYKLTEQSGEVDLENGERRGFRPDAVTLRRKGGVCCIHKASMATVYRFDGKVLRGISTNDPMDIRGTIRENDGRVVADVFYNHMLGYRMHGDDQVSLSLWLRHQIPAKKKIEVEADGEDVRVKVVSLPNFYDECFWLSPSRDWMPMKYQTVPANERWNRITWGEVEEARQVEGLWVPWKVVRRMRVGESPDRESRMEYEVSEFEIGKTSDEDLTIDFPPGTTVNDSVRNVIYRVGEDGQEQVIRRFRMRRSRANAGGGAT